MTAWPSESGPSGPRTDRPDRLSVSPGVLLFAAAAALVAGECFWLERQLSSGLPWVIAGLAAAFLCRLRCEPDPPVTAGRLSAREYAFLAILVLAGGALRFIALDQWPPGGFFDEVQNHLVADQILGGWRPIFVSDLSQMPAFYFYLLAGAIRLAGRGLMTVRGLSALVGTLTLPAFYLLARRAFAVPLAMASAVLLAGSRWHLTFSRVGFTGILGPFIEVLAVLALWKALDTGKLRSWVLLGVTVGLGVQSYYSFNLFPAVLTVLLLAHGLHHGPKALGDELARAARGLAVAVVIAVILLAPLAWFALHNRETFFQRSNTVAIWNPAHHLAWPAALRSNVVSHLLMFQYRGDSNPRHNIPYDPILNPVSGLLLALGLGAALARPMRFPQAVWLAWFVVMLLPAVLTIESPQAYRSVGVIPAVCLLAGEGGALIAAAAGGKRGRAAAFVLVGLLACASAALDVSRYFRVQVRHPLAWPAFDGDYHAMARYVRPFGGRYDIYVSSIYFDYPVTRFYLGDDFPYRRFSLTEHLPLRADPVLPSRQGVLYVLDPLQSELKDLFRELYPKAEIQEHLDPSGRLMFTSVVVGEQEIHPVARPLETGFLGSYYGNERFEGPPAMVRRDPGICFHFHWQEEALDSPFSVDWAAHLRVDVPGTYSFRVRASGPAVLVVDDRTFHLGAIDQTKLEHVSVELAGGEHRLALRYVEKSWAAAACLLWQPPGQRPSIIPMSALRPFEPEEYARLRPSLPLPRS